MELLQDITTDYTESLKESDDSLKPKIIFMGGFLTRKYQASRAKDDDDDAQERHESSEFTQQLNRRGLSFPKLSTAYFVHRAVYILGKLSHPMSSCRQYLARLLSYVDAPISVNAMACRTVAKRSTEGSRASSQ